MIMGMDWGTILFLGMMGVALVGVVWHTITMVRNKGDYY